MPVEQRVAVFDIDGTLWCEKPQYTMVEFLLAELRRRWPTSPALADAPGVPRRARLGPARPSAGWDAINVVLALVELHAGITPEVFEARVRALLQRRPTPAPRGALSADALPPHARAHRRAAGTRTSTSTSSPAAGSEFIRAVSARLLRGEAGGRGRLAGRLRVRARGAARRGCCARRRSFGDPNEGAAKIANIQRLLGRRPILAAGNQRRRHRDARVRAGLRRARRWRCSWTTTTRSASTSTPASRARSRRRSRSPRPRRARAGPSSPCSGTGPRSSPTARHEEAAGGLPPAASDRGELRERAAPAGPRARRCAARGPAPVASSTMMRSRKRSIGLVQADDGLLERADTARWRLSTFSPWSCSRADDALLELGDALLDGRRRACRTC